MVGLGNIDDVYKHYIVVIEENQQLKELLQECRERLGDYAEFCIKGGYLNAEDEAVKMITKINNVIGEKK